MIVLVWEPSTVIAAASAIAAWVALLLSLLNAQTSRKALRLSERQEERRKPSLSVYLQEGFFSSSLRQNARVYAFLLSVTNRSDNNNSIAEATLHLTYSKEEGNELTVKFAANSEIPAPFRQTQERMPIPTRVDAHQVVSGWYFFSVDDAILQNTRVERMVVAIRDTHGNEVEIKPILIREYFDENNEQSGGKEDVSKVK